jgi:hypothetical protein
MKVTTYVREAIRNAWCSKLGGTEKNYMTYRKLRIAWSVACGIVAVLLCVLWVRSYWYQDAFLFRNSPVMFGGISLMGSVATGVQQVDDDMPTLYADSLSIESTLV